MFLWHLDCRLSLHGIGFFRSKGLISSYSNINQKRLQSSECNDNAKHWLSLKSAMREKSGQYKCKSLKGEGSRHPRRDQYVVKLRQ